MPQTIDYVNESMAMASQRNQLQPSIATDLPMSARGSLKGDQQGNDLRAKKKASKFKSSIGKRSKSHASSISGERTATRSKK